MILLKNVEKKYFHSFEYRCVFEFTFTKMENNEVILTITLGYMKYKPQLFGIKKTIKTARNNGFIFNQIVKLTIKIDSSLSIINIHYLKLQIPIMHGDFFRIISRKPEYVKTFCNDLYNAFHFACRR